MCVYRTCLFICLKHRGDFNTILHAQLEFSFHDIFNNAFRQGFAAGELINLGNHLAIGDPFVLKVPGLVIVHVMGFGNPVKLVDAWIPAGNRFFKSVPGPMY